MLTRAQLFKRAATITLAASVPGSVWEGLTKAALPPAPRAELALIAGSVSEGASLIMCDSSRFMLGDIVRHLPSGETHQVVSVNPIRTKLWTLR